MHTKTADSMKRTGQQSRGAVNELDFAAVCWQTAVANVLFERSCSLNLEDCSFKF